MADLFDYIFTCASCSEQYETEGRRAVDFLLSRLNGLLKRISCGYEEQVCEYCLPSTLSPEQIEFTVGSALFEE